MKKSSIYSFPLIIIIALLSFSCLRQKKYYGTWYMDSSLIEENVTMDILKDNTVLFPQKEKVIITVTNTKNGEEHIFESECLISMKDDNYDKGFINFKKNEIVIFRPNFVEFFNFVTIGDSILIMTSIESGDDYSFFHERTLVRSVN